MELHLHPVLVHFPVALFVTAFGSEILSLIFKKEVLHKVAIYNYLFAILGAIAAVLAGWYEAEHIRHPIFSLHKNFAYTTVIFSSLGGMILFFIKNKISKKIFRLLFFIILLVSASLVLTTGYFGGKMVYEYGVGVEG